MTRVTTDTPYLGEPAITLECDSYRAVLVPRWGGNLIQFENRRRGWQFLREPGSLDELKARPGIYGMPILFPPNRYQDGQFELFGQSYQMPINEPERHNFIHGILNQLPWSVVASGSTRRAAYVVVSQKVDEGHPMYAFFPHRFEIHVAYTLSARGIRQWVRVRNHGRLVMPVMLGFHTAFRFPFDPKSRADDCVLKMDIGHRIDLDERGLPTGAFSPPTAFETEVAGGGGDPFVDALDNHYTVRNEGRANRATILDRRTGVALTYQVGRSFRYWMAWNDGARGGFVCLEPQTNMVNAPRFLHPQELGVVRLEPSASYWESSRLFVSRSDKQG